MTAWLSRCGSCHGQSLNVKNGSNDGLPKAERIGVQKREYWAP